jgi:hypothetical protein
MHLELLVNMVPFFPVGANQINDMRIGIQPCFLREVHRLRPLIAGRILMSLLIDSLRAKVYNQPS